MGTRTALFSRHQPGGVFDLTDLEKHPGDVWFVDSTNAAATDSVGYGQNPDKPLATLDYAIGLCTASKGDVIYVMPGHAETITSAVTCDVAGVSIIGLGRGRIKPAFTGSGAIDVFTITAASVHLRNVRIVGASANVTALVNVAGADVELIDLVLEPAETPLMSITVASGANRLTIGGLRWRGTAAGPDCVVDFEAHVEDWHFYDWIVNATTSGCDLGVLRANVDAVPGGIAEDIRAIGLDTLFVDFNSSDAVGEGLFINCAWQHAAAATAANGYDLGGYGMHLTGVSDGANRAAILHPATSAT